LATVSPQPWREIDAHDHQRITSTLCQNDSPIIDCDATCSRVSTTLPLGKEIPVERRHQRGGPPKTSLFYRC